MSVERLNFNSLRLLLFFFFAGVGCLLPFISLHLKSSGLSTEEIRIISIVSPLIATLGPLLLGPLVDYLSAKRKNELKKSVAFKTDRNTYIRTVLSCTVLLSAIFYCLLLSVPISEDIYFHQQTLFVCNEHGASLVQEKCSDLNCFQFPNERSGIARLKNCRFDCSFPSHYGNIENTNDYPEAEGKTTHLPPTVRTTTVRTTTVRTTTVRTTSPRPRIIRPEIDISNLNDFFGAEPNDDYDGDGSGEDPDFDWHKQNRKRDTKGDSELSLEEFPHICHDRFTDTKKSRSCFVFTPNSAGYNVNIFLKAFYEADKHCSYPLGGKFSCRIPKGLEKPNESCKVICDLQNLIENGFIKSQCGHILSDPELAFWTYLLFRSFGDLFFAASIGLLIGATIVAAGDEAGREFILPSLSYGLFAMITGYLHSDDLSPLQLENIPNFFIGIVGFGFFSVLALFILIFAANLSIGPPEWWKNTRHVEFRNKGEFSGILCVLILLGILWAPIYFHVPWHITEPGGLELYVGCATAVGALLSVPFVWKAYKIVDYCGYSNILIGAFTIYILRYTGLLFIENPWVLTIIGGMEAITLCLMLFAAVFYVRHLVPKRMTFTSQSFVVATHFCLGGGLGCLISTLISPYDLASELLPGNGTLVDHETEYPKTEEGPRPYHLIYCVGAIFTAAVAVAYFTAYHCCLKKRCLAPLYRNDHSGAIPQEPGENGMYTPLRIIRNGRQTRTESS